MASIANAIQFSGIRSQVLNKPAAFSTSTTTTCKSSGSIPLAKRSVIASQFEFSSSLESDKLCFTPVDISAKSFKFSGWNQLLRRRGAVEFPVTKAAAADADGHDIEITHRLET